MTELDALVARIEALEAEREITRTLHAYGHTIGRGEDDGWIDCFTEDGVFEVRRRPLGATGATSHPHPDVRAGGDGAAIRYEGAGLRQFISRHPRPPSRWHKHIVVDPAIILDGAAVSVVSFFVRLDAGPNGHPHLTAFGRYVDRMARCDDGRWRFRHRIAEVESRGADPI